MTSALTLAVLFPLLTSAQGDESNATVLAHRARLRGIDADVVVHHDGRLPDADCYLLGGLETSTMALLVERLRVGGFPQIVADSDPVVLGVDAGLQVLGRSFSQADGSKYDGLGLLDITSTWRSTARLGPVVGRLNARLGGLDLGGYESHFATCERGEGVEPFAYLDLGLGDAPDPESPPPRVDGATVGRVIGTHVHGPLLARNPDLADLLLSWAVGEELAPASGGTAHRLRDQRMAEDIADPTGWGGRVYGRARRQPRPRRQP
jgi:lipid II isoglutaminyl synthase (glutamine-hydrolysing)